MKISLNWLKKYVDIPVSDEELIRLIGARLVEVEGVIDETHKYDNIYIVRVESAERIPGTHLTLCRVNAGQAFSERAAEKGPDSAFIQVVCGAPNVREGMLAVWIAPGAVVPASAEEDAPFVIGKRKMQGYESNGMLAGADELGFGDDHSGIVEIDPEMAKPGDLLADIFDLNDLILEIENKSLTHRPDCFGIIGFAREVAGILGLKFERAENSSQAFVPQKRQASNVVINVSSTEICQRYTAVVLKKHGELKKKYLTWVDTVLSKSGMKPISPVVDATNYLMLLTGQPLHAFDYDKFVQVGGAGKVEIQIRLARKGEKLVLLDDREVVLGSDDIVICSGDMPVALAGAMGGKSTEITEDTRNIILEAATFSLYNLRKTQMRHGIFSEAITRFTKGQPAYQTLSVAEDFVEMVADGFEVGAVVDEYPKPAQPVVVKITTDEINQLLGTSYDEKLIIRTLENTGFKITVGAVLEILVPKWRTDIHIKEDIIEEVGRLLGYDNIKPTLPLHGTAEKNEMMSLKQELREILAKFGANEVLTYSFVSEKLLAKVGQEAKNSYKIINSISPELQYIRQSIVPSLLDKAYINQKMPVDEFAIFEMNKVYERALGVDAEKVPNEKISLGFVVAERKNMGTAFYLAKKYADKILKELNIKAEFLPKKSEGAFGKPFEAKRAADIWIDGECVGVVGEFRNSVRNEFKLAPFLAGFEIDLDMILKHKTNQKEIYVGKKEKRDLTITTTKSYGEIVKEVEDLIEGEGLVAEIQPLGIYQPEGVNEKNITMHLEFTKFDEKVMEELENL